VKTKDIRRKGNREGKVSNTRVACRTRGNGVGGGLKKGTGGEEKRRWEGETSKFPQSAVCR